MSVYETTEQKARDMVKRMGVETGYLSSGDVVELANLIAAVEGFTWDDVDHLRELGASRVTHGHGDYGPPDQYDPWIKNLADRIAALLPPRDP